MPNEKRKLAKNTTVAVKRAVKSGQMSFDKKKTPYNVAGHSGTVSKKGKVKLK
jgi:hypothetical protein